MLDLSGIWLSGLPRFGLFVSRTQAILADSSSGRCSRETRGAALVGTFQRLDIVVVDVDVVHTTVLFLFFALAGLALGHIWSRLGLVSGGLQGHVVVLV